MDNIFENAYFGKAYKTRDGRKAVLITYNQRNKQSPYVCAISCYFDGSIKSVCHNFYPNGQLHDNLETVNDIVSEWEEFIDEEKLDELANSQNKLLHLSTSQLLIKIWNNGFKAGYKKAKEE